MLRLTFFVIALALAGTIGLAHQARAASLPGVGLLAGPAAQSQSLVQKVHGCHHYWKHGHKHVGHYCKKRYYKKHHHHRKKHHHYRKRHHHHHHKKTCLYIGGVRICK